jgi:hypothetical protein
MHYPLGKYGAQLLTLGNLAALTVCVFELFQVTIKSHGSGVISRTIKILENMHYPLGKYGAQLLLLLMVWCVA